MNTETATDLVYSRAVADVEWMAYEHPKLPAGEGAAQVKILHPTCFLAWFPPGFTAPAHSHPGDTTYYVLEGEIQFGDEGWVGPNSVRGVAAGHVYGPEKAHPEKGVLFLLVSSEEITIDWADDHLQADEVAQ